MPSKTLSARQKAKYQPETAKSAAKWSRAHTHSSGKLHDGIPTSKINRNDLLTLWFHRSETFWVSPGVHCTFVAYSILTKNSYFLNFSASQESDLRNPRSPLFIFAPAEWFTDLRALWNDLYSIETSFEMYFFAAMPSISDLQTCHKRVEISSSVRRLYLGNLYAFTNL